MAVTKVTPGTSLAASAVTTGGTTPHVFAGRFVRTSTYRSISARGSRVIGHAKVGDVTR